MKRLAILGVLAIVAGIGFSGDDGTKAKAAPHKAAATVLSQCGKAKAAEIIGGSDGLAKAALALAMAKRTPEKVIAPMPKEARKACDCDTPGDCDCGPACDCDQPAAKVDPTPPVKESKKPERELWEINGKLVWKNADGSFDDSVYSPSVTTFAGSCAGGKCQTQPVARGFFK